MAKAGAPPKFMEAHVNWVFWKIASKEPMGRKEIVKETGLGEGSIRTILEKLDEYGLVKSAKIGRTLSDDGKKVRDSLRKIVEVRRIDQLKMSKGSKNVAVLVKGSSNKIKTGMEQRDAAIRIGRGGVTTLLYKKGKLIMPGFGDDMVLDKKYPEDSKAILDAIEPQDGDVIVIGSEDSNQKAEEAAWIGASTILS
ncbi:MAG: DUF4443 domain-containing protein [Candidatus Altiarchaeota archaeon]|nr:DUF4443 domain-containing protein [Candidatus Altiarchaeota archaeon]